MDASVPVVRVAVRLVQALAVVPAAWHVWLVVVSRRLADGGHNDEALFAAIGDPVVMLVVKAIASFNINMSLAALNALGITMWVVLGGLGIFAAHRIGHLIQRREEANRRPGHAAA
jgi:hypothetical protein